MLAEIETLECTVSSHGFTLYGIGEDNWPEGVLQAKDLNQFRGKLVTMMGRLITYKRTRTGKGELMKFLSLEDPTGTFEVTLFPKMYQKFGHLLQNQGPFQVKGIVERDGHCQTVTALWLGRVGHIKQVPDTPDHHF